MGNVINWIIISLPVPVIAGLVFRDTGRMGVSARARCWWTVGALCLFPVVPIVYLATRKNKVRAEEEQP